MTNKMAKVFGSIITQFIVVFGIALTVSAQYSGTAKMPPRYDPNPPRTLTGVIKVPKSFGVIPRGRGQTQPGSPCGQFYVAVLNPAKGNKMVAIATTDPGRDQGEFYTCKYTMQVPSNKQLYAIAGMGGTNLLPQQDRYELYITDAWIGGTNNKPRRGYERGFSGKFITLTKKDMYLSFELQYAQVDPN